MKKYFMLLLVVVFALASAAVAADNGLTKIYEGDDDFDLYMTLPENVIITGSGTMDDFTHIEVAVEGNDQLWVSIIIAPDELYADKSLADLTDEEVSEFVGWYTEEMIKPDVQRLTNNNGIDYIILNESTEDNDSSETVTLVRGYDIMISVFLNDYSELDKGEETIGFALMDTLQAIDK
jgi:hypothetical protein